MVYDAIIIGGGLSGMACAARLAHYGWHVRLFERHALLGGLNSYFYRGGACMDVGLHAMTNYAEVSQRSAPINKLLRQLRIRYCDLELCPQTFSTIESPGHCLKFTNDFSVLEQEIAREFPDESAGFQTLVDYIRNYDVFNPSHSWSSAREVLKKYISSTQLTDMLLLPVMSYGCSDVDDMDFSQFGIIFRSMFLEGLARPRKGILTLMKLLKQRLHEGGVELCLGNGVKKISCEHGAVSGVIDDNGKEYYAKRIFSCAGARESLQLLEDSSLAQEVPKGQLGFVESVFQLEKSPAEFGFEACISFRNFKSSFAFRPPEGAVDEGSYIFCAPGNYTGCEGTQFRMTQLANPDFWLSCDSETYISEKNAVIERQITRMNQLWPGMGDSVKNWELFTPKTIRRFTGKENGAIYGSPKKYRNGTSPLEGLYFIGTDQGYLGIVGAMLSGTVIANLALME